MAKQNYMQIEERRGYPWPASALTGVEMAALADWREKTGTPISELVRQSVEAIGKMITRRPANKEQ